MQKCYNCGLEVDDNVLICPECGALVKRYGRPEPQPAQQPQTDAFTFDNAPQPQGAVWVLPDGKRKFRGYVTFWLVLSAILTGYTLFGFACTLFIVRFRDLYFDVIGQLPEFASFVELLRSLVDSVTQYQAYYIAVGVLVGVQFVGTIWFLASKRKLAFYVMAAAATVLTILQLIMGGGLNAVIYVLEPLVTWVVLRKSWSLLK